MMQNAGNSLQYLAATKTDIGAKVGKTCLLITIFKENVIGLIVKAILEKLLTPGEEIMCVERV